MALYEYNAVKLQTKQEERHHIVRCLVLSLSLDNGNHPINRHDLSV